MTDQEPSATPTKYYFYDDATLTVYYSDELDPGHNFIYLGTSDNPNPKMAVAAFTQRAKISSGYKIVELG